MNQRVFTKTFFFKVKIEKERKFNVFRHFTYSKDNGVESVICFVEVINFKHLMQPLFNDVHSRKYVRSLKPV